MRFLGMDYGKKRIGLALSDEAGRLAFPKEILKNDKNFLGSLKEVLQKENVSEIVVGESLNFKQEPNAVFADIVNLVSELKKRFSLPVHLEKEFWTTVEARRYDDSPADARAAALILQRYLDRRSRPKSEGYRKNQS